MADKLVPLFRLGNHFSTDRYKQILEEVLETENWTLGPKTERFEHIFCEHFGHSHAVAVSNGTNAITLLLRSFEVKEVWMSDTTFIGVWCAVDQAGVKWVKTIKPANEKTWDVTTDQWLEKYQSMRSFKPTWIIITHLYGSRSDVDIERLKREYGVKVLEDMSQCHGLPASPHSDAQIYSLYPTKNLGALGEGGIITTNSKGIADVVRSNRFYGYNSNKSKVSKGGNNYKMDEVQAAFLIDKLESGTFYTEIDTRREVASKYEKSIMKNPNIYLPKFSHDCVYHLHPVWVEDREHFRKYMLDNNIQTGTHYPYSVSTMCDYGIHKNTSKWNDHCVTLPMGGYLYDDEISAVCGALENYRR